MRGTLRQWLEAYGTGKKTVPDGTLTSSPPQYKPPPLSPAGQAEETLQATIARLEARVAEPEMSEKMLATERIFASGRPSTSPGRRAGESLPVRRRQLRHRHFCTIR